MSSQYDNTNQGGLWKAASVSGTLDIEGEKYSCDIIGTGKEGKTPSHTVYIRDRNTQECFGGALWKDEPDKNRYAGGQISVHGVEYWLALFTCDSDKPRSPAFNIKLNRKDAAPQQGQSVEQPQYETVPPPRDDEVPF